MNMYKSLSAFLSLILILSASLNSYAQDDQDAPEFFLKPKADTENTLYSVAMGNTYEEAMILAFQRMGEKIEVKVQAVQETESQSALKGATSKSLADAKDEIKSSTSKSIVSQKFGNIDLQSVETLSERYEDDKYLSNYENTVKLFYEKRKQARYMANLATKENENGELSHQFNYVESKANFGDMLDYINAHTLMDYTFAARWSKKGYVYYVELACDQDLFKEQLNPDEDADDTSKRRGSRLKRGSKRSGGN
jgi:uncharacterized protein YxeA